MEKKHFGDDLPIATELRSLMASVEKNGEVDQSLLALPALKFTVSAKSGASPGA
jgi:hypothetical protein